jgi:hypothetical protein
LTVERVFWHDLDKFFRGRRNFTGTRVRILGRIVKYVCTVVGRIHGDFACVHPAARRDQQHRDSEVT